MVTKKDTNKARQRRHNRVRAKISGTASAQALCLPLLKSHIGSGY